MEEFNEQIRDESIYNDKLLNKVAYPDLSNLHTHGAYVTPAPPGDDVGLVVRPQEEFEYTYSFPKEALPGMSWVL